MNNKTFEDLLAGYVGNKLTKDELAHFLELLKNKEHEGSLQDGIDKLMSDQSLSGFSDGARKDLLFKKIMDSAKTEAVEDKHVVPLNRGRLIWWRSVAAAVVLFIIVGMLFYTRGDSTEKHIAATEKKSRYKNDVAPGGNKAVLTLSDGSTIILDDAKDGILMQEGNTKVLKLDGKLAYNTSANAQNEISYNTITTPAGGQYQIRLADGSEVWLNAGSSLRFPTAFTGKERKVEITGEGYFEIAKDKAMPFVVSVNKAEIQVLGTHFNVMAYHDEETLSTTLVEGSIKFVHGNTANVLKPNQQLRLRDNKDARVFSDIDVQEVVAWKNGSFQFENADIKSIMRQIARWYDVEIIYKNTRINEVFFLEMPRSSNLSDILKVLELTGNIHFEIEGKKVFVLP